MKRLQIGISACFDHADPKRALFKDKTLLYLEESKSHWIMEGGALPFMLPSCIEGISASDIVEAIDGLVLHGGADVAPESYGETPLKPEWKGDRKRDIYELALIDACVKQGKPVLGVCRGLQILNVYLGGSLHQDLANAKFHRNWDVYEQNLHEVEVQGGGLLEKMYPDKKRAIVNSVHHQGIKKLAPPLRVEALCTHDQTIEAVSFEQKAASDPWILAVQWHPEWKRYLDKSHESKIFASAPIRDTFLAEVKKRKKV